MILIFLCILRKILDLQKIKKKVLDKQKFLLPTFDGLSLVGRPKNDLTISKNVYLCMLENLRPL